MEFNPNRVNIFIEAETKSDLIELQLINNAFNGKAYNYQTPMKDGDMWIVWFFADPTQTMTVTSEMLKGDMLGELS